MELLTVLHMNRGEGVTSYAMNSLLQKTVIYKARPFLHNLIKQLFYRSTPPSCLVVADLGCSSGPNSLFVISDIIKTIRVLREGQGNPSPEAEIQLQVFLNDLPGNDFNTIFKSIPQFHEQLRKEKGDGFGACYIAGVPGSFYGRLFPTNSIWFAHSSYSIMWLSQVPKGIETNKGNIYITKTSPPCVFEAYKKQFNKDFSLFLSSRSKEIISGGGMFITMIGKRSCSQSSKECCPFWELLAKSLQDMVTLGYVEEAMLHSFNIPWYNPSPAEIANLVKKEGSFKLDVLETFDINWDGSDDVDNKDNSFDKVTSGREVAKILRAVAESMLVNHFGKEIIDELFNRFSEHVSEQLVKEKIKHVNVVMCMTKKG